MAVRRGEVCDVTVAAATVDRNVADRVAYEETRRTIARIAEEAIRREGIEGAHIAVNTADEPAPGSVYLTVTGTSAESGDDGEAGRGNRANGLITPGRPMSIEAAAGKNPITHVGKLYNIAAGRIAAALVAELEPVTAAQCLLVSRIGRPINDPQVAEATISTADASPPERLSAEIEAIVRRELEAVPALSNALISGQIRLDAPTVPCSVTEAEP
jgi:S-adenosylmethionine synthetase